MKQNKKWNHRLMIAAEILLVLLILALIGAIWLPAIIGADPLPAGR